ncbi:hypothetical protein TNCT_458431 [Trichonephila clavata]|uniref:Uncharacterized protein n=1 Tax=Trichonephila clavata TaxID=2740835 RepID=A0A8X6KWU0_TRICU|nr:hypothetical protein TNCT_458431 [Trichonephila clavata]
MEKRIVCHPIHFFSNSHATLILFARSLSVEEIVPGDYDKLDPPQITKGESILPVNVSVHLCDTDTLSK